MKTEAEARKCWCPFDHGTRKPILASEGALCIASECMAWRHGEPEREYSGNPEHNETLEAKGFRPTGERSGMVRTFERPSGRGYCGLAGVQP